MYNSYIEKLTSIKSNIDDIIKSLKSDIETTSIEEMEKFISTCKKRSPYSCTWFTGIGTGPPDNFSTREDWIGSCVCIEIPFISCRKFGIVGNDGIIYGLDDNNQISQITDSGQIFQAKTGLANEIDYIRTKPIYLPNWTSEQFIGAIYCGTSDKEIATIFAKRYRDG